MPDGKAGMKRLSQVCLLRLPLCVFPPPVFPKSPACFRKKPCRFLRRTSLFRGYVSDSAISLAGMPLVRNRILDEMAVGCFILLFENVDLFYVDSAEY